MKKRKWILVCGTLACCAVLAGGCQSQKTDKVTKQPKATKEVAKATPTPVKEEQPEEVEAKVGEINIDGKDIRKNNINGLTYKGFGILSGNSSSDLLMDYREQSPKQYKQLIRFLFGGEQPIMNHVKLEMGNDQNNSTGTVPATMRSKKEKANVLRDAGWQLAADAKKENPNLKISILRWNAPAWVQTEKDVYNWYKKTVLAAYKKYGYMVDYINPNINEAWGREKDIAYTKKFAKWIAKENAKTIPDDTARRLFQKIKLVVSDESSGVSPGIAETIKKDKVFKKVASVVGYHYNTEDDQNDGMKWLAQKQDKEIWNSEAQATFSNSAFRPSNNTLDPTVAGTGIGGTGSALEMGNTFIAGFVKSRRTHVIYQPAIASFYEGNQYSYKELVSARDPWSGWMHYDAGLLVLSHVSKFAKTGWENEKNTAGIWRGIPEASKSTAEGTNPVNGRNGGENYMTLAAPSKKDFSSVIVNDSQYPMHYQITVKNMKLKENQKLAVWETKAADDGGFDENYMKHREDISGNDKGIYELTVAPYSVVTVTTLKKTAKEEVKMALPKEGERTVLDTDETGAKQDIESSYLYADSFDNADRVGKRARYTNTLNGAFENVKTKSSGYVMRQQLDEKTYGVGKAWNKGDPTVLLGDIRWMNYTAEVGCLFENEGENQYASIAIRQTGDSHKLEASSGYTLKVSISGKWELYRRAEVVASGTAGTKEKYQSGAQKWNILKLSGEGDTIKAYINDVLVKTYKDSNPITVGRIGLGSAYTFTQFRALKVMKISGAVPYYTELLDNMETYDLTPEKNAKLVYEGKWAHEEGKAMFVYQRSMSTATEPGASLSYQFTGTGMEILAGTDSSATLQVTVDGKVVSEKAKTQKAGNMNMIYSLTNLAYGEHSVTLTLKKGTFCVDAVGILGEPAK